MSNYEKGKYFREYKEWYIRKYPDQYTKSVMLKRSKYAQKEGFEETLQILMEVLKKVVLKMDFNLDPIEICMSDDSGEIVSRSAFEFGNILMLIDELYAKKHFFKFMGIRLESKKSVYILENILKVVILYLYHLC